MINLHVYGKDSLYEHMIFYVDCPNTIIEHYNDGDGLTLWV